MVHTSLTLAGISLFFFRIQEEQNEEDEAIDMSEFDEDQLKAVKSMMSNWLNAALTGKH